MQIRQLLPTACVLLTACGGKVLDVSEGGDRSGADLPERTPTGTGTTGPSQDPSASPAPPVGRGADPNASCNDLEQLGDVVAPIVDPDLVTAPTGGTIVPGTYVKVAFIRRDASTEPFTGPATLRITSSSLELVFSRPGEASYRRVSERIVSIVGVNMTATTTCPAEEGPSGRVFTATPTMISFYGFNRGESKAAWRFDYQRVLP